MKRIAIYGAGGFGREVRSMLDFQRDLYTFAGYLDDFKFVTDKANQFDDVLLSIADTSIRTVLVKKAISLKSVPFESLISPDVRIHSSVTIDRGCIICPGVKFTTDIRLGQFVIVNLNTTIGHDVVIGDFCSLMPSVNISGNVTLGKRVFVGTGATILQGVTVSDDVVIGAGAVVLSDVPANKTVVGVPARVINHKATKPN
jgi:sugar O-acyltransferase (sialic acid O-acetyltransferase NeuD family)